MYWEQFWREMSRFRSLKLEQFPEDQRQTVPLSWLCLFQNGYPARRRSLVDDARFETLVVKQTKQSVLDEARHRANGKELSLACFRLVFDLVLHVIFVFVILDPSLEPEVDDIYTKPEQENDETAGKCAFPSEFP